MATWPAFAPFPARDLGLAAGLADTEPEMEVILGTERSGVFW